MKLYIGGVCQGQLKLAIRENPGAEIFDRFHETVRNMEDPAGYAWDFYQLHPDAVIVADEVGSGIVPLDAADRAYRENVGRALCVIAQNAESVTRAVCGIGVRIK